MSYTILADTTTTKFHPTRHLNQKLPLFIILLRNSNFRCTSKTKRDQDNLFNCLNVQNKWWTNHSYATSLYYRYNYEGLNKNQLDVKKDTEKGTENIILISNELNGKEINRS